MPNPPLAKKESHVTEIHGLKLHDDYFWLRNKDTDEVIRYLKAENSYTSEMMAHNVKLQENLFLEMKGRIKETDESVPMKIGDYYYYYRTEEGKNYSIHCRKFESLDNPEEIILDENILAKGKEYMSIGSLKVSPNQKFIAYSVDFTGGETFDIHIVDLSTKETFDKVVQVSKLIEWDIDNDAIFYSELDDIHRPFTVCRHELGTEQNTDERLLEESDTRFYVEFKKSNDKRFLLCSSTNYSSETCEIHYSDLQEKNRKLQVFFPRTEGIELSVDHHDGFFYFIINSENPVYFKLMRTKEIAIERKNWEGLSDRNLEVRIPYLKAFQNFIVVYVRKNGYANLMIYNILNGETHEISQPESIYGIQFVENPVFETDIFRYVLSSPVTPKSVYDYNMASRKLELRKIDEIKNFNPTEYVTERRYAEAGDGTKIPISLAYEKDTKIDGSSPLLLYGYGSYGISSDPHFDSERLCLIERGVIFAIAHIRGGGEYGKHWYRKGKLSYKMNTFTDFIACAKYLIKEKFSSKQKLCAYGVSAGGLLMGAIVNMHPELFGCVVAKVPFVDVINTMLDDSIPLTTFEFKEWGNPKIREEFDWLMEYSPYDNIEAKDYPPLLITAGYNDPNVQYWEPAKWAAKLRSLKTDDNLLLLKTKMGSGHKGSSGRYTQMKDFAFIYSFILDTMNLSH